MLGGRANAQRRQSHQTSSPDVTRGVYLFSTSQSSRSCPFQSTSICFVVLIVRSCSALLRAISIFFFITLCVHFPLSYCYRRVIDAQRVTCVTNDQTQSDRNPHTKSAIFSTSSITFLRIGGDRKNFLPFLDARDPYLLNGMNAILSISLEK